MPLTLGIGVVTRNRLPLLQHCIAALRQHTRFPYVLMIADDGSADETVRWAQHEGIPIVTGPRRGCAWNKNRALFYLQQRTDCDPLLLFEDDTWPVAEGWEQVWMAAAQRWLHINYCYGFDPNNPPKGCGTADQPFECAAFGGHCTVTTRQALAEVGFLDSRFIGYGWEHVEWSHRFRLTYHDRWALPDGMFPCLDHGVQATWPPSSFNRQEQDRNGAIYAATRANPAEPIYRAPWRDAGEHRQLHTEVAASGPQGLPHEQLGREGPVITTPFAIISCSWPRTVQQVAERWISQPEWDAPLMPITPQPQWKPIGHELCWTIDWRAFFRQGLKPYHPALSGEMRGFHLVFQLRIDQSGTLVFWDDEGCVIRRCGQIIHDDRSAHGPARSAIQVRAGDCLQVAQWQHSGDWLWGARFVALPQADTTVDLAQRYLAPVQERLRQPGGPALKLFTHGRSPMRAVVALYSMILNGYAPDRVLVFGEHQWSREARELFGASLPFAIIVPTAQVVEHIRSVGGSRLAEMAQQHWFVLKTLVALLWTPTESCSMDDDVFVLDQVGDALEAFRSCDLVFAPDCDWGGTYQAAWGQSFDQTGPLHTGTFNAGLFWSRAVEDPAHIAMLARNSQPDQTPAYVWEQGLIAMLYGRRASYELPTQRYFYPLWDGLPGGCAGYDYAGNPCGIASVHFGGLSEKPSDSMALKLAPAILGRVP